MGRTQKQAGKRKKGKKVIIIICILVAAGVVAVLLGMHSCGRGNWFDTTAQTGSLAGKTQEEIQEELNRIVEEGNFNISIASKIYFENGGAEGSARIENISANHYNMKVAITLDETGETIYESGGLKPGQFIEKIRLLRDLPEGTYSATAVFTAYTQDDLSRVGQAAAQIEMIVEG